MALPNTKVIIHQVSSGFRGEATDIEIHAREILDLRRAWMRCSPTTPASLEQIHQDTERDYFLSGEEAKDYGLIDRVIESH